MIAPMRCIIGAVIILALSTCSWGQEGAKKKAMRTGEMWNGRFWRELPNTDKDIFLNGYMECLRMIEDQTGERIGRLHDLASAFYWPTKLSADEVREALDRIYSTPENRRIPIVMVISQVIKMTATGEGEAAVQKKITELRAKASSQ
jgi:hypothetical protein